jgi:DNA-binding NtrC family response regulator
MSIGQTESARFTVLLVDLKQIGEESKQAESQPDLQRILEQVAEIHWASWADDIEGILEKIQKTGTRVLFFEYDYPDIIRLSWLQQIKLRHPSIPIIFVTEQHSEALAIWALRSRVWDYFVKPLVTAEIFHCIESLKAVIAEQSRGAPRKAILPPHAIPADARFRGGSQKKMPLMQAFPI